MDDDDTQTVSQMVRQGTYFHEARAWYRTVYLGMIPERSFFLVISLLAAATGLFALIGFTHLMPLSPRRPLLIHARDIVKDTPYLTRLRGQKEPIDAALMRFFTLAYVSNREEAADATSLAQHQAFVLAHSDASLGTDYQNSIKQAAPDGLAALIAAGGKREVQLQDYQLTHSRNAASATQTATVLFTTTDSANNQQTKAHWRVTLEFTYTPMMSKEVVDNAQGATIIETQDPQFQVTRYEREKLP